MKRKNINVKANNISEEETSSDDQQVTDQDSDLEGAGESIVDNDEAEESDDLDASATDTDEDESDINSDDDVEPKSENIRKDQESDDLAASATDTDEDESDIINSDDNGEDVKPKISKSEKIKEGILQRYQERQGKQLYVRFPHKVPETQEALEEKIRGLTPLVVKVHKPRQRHVRFCLIDFASKEDRDIALSKLKKSIKKGELEKYVVSIPRTESSDFVQELAEHKIKSMENKKAKMLLRKASKKSLKENNFTSSIIVFNLPQNATVLEIRKLFANAVDINIRPGKGKLNKGKSIAAITFPTTLDARNVIRKKLSLGGNQLVIRFDNKGLKKNSKNIGTKNMAINESSQESKPRVQKRKLEPTVHNAEDKMPKDGPVHKPKINKKSNVKKNTVKNKPKCAAK